MDEAAFVEKLCSMRAYFESGCTRPVQWRKHQLKALKAMFAERHDDFAAALGKDLRKNEFETLTSEVGFVVAEIDHAIRHLDSWMRIGRRAPPGVEDNLQKEECPKRLRWRRHAAP